MIEGRVAPIEDDFKYLCVAAKIFRAVRGPTGSPASCLSCVMI